MRRARIAKDVKLEGRLALKEVAWFVRVYCYGKTGIYDN